MTGEFWYAMANYMHLIFDDERKNKEIEIWDYSNWRVMSLLVLGLKPYYSYQRIFLCGETSLTYQSSLDCGIIFHFLFFFSFCYEFKSSWCWNYNPIWVLIRNYLKRENSSCTSVWEICHCCFNTSQWERYLFLHLCFDL